MLRRTLYQKIRDHMTRKELTLIVGPRQAGKTYILRLLQQDLRTKGTPSIFLNLDIEEDRKYFVSQERLLQKIRLDIGDNEGIIFIDEMQRKEDAGLFLKGIYDMNLPYKFVISGSGSLELKEKIHESLAGRKRMFELLPLTFEEFVDYKTENKYVAERQAFYAVEPTRTRQILEEYMMFGGYPRVVLAETREEKHAEMREIYQSYLERDIQDLLGLEKSERFINLVRLIGSQLGSTVNYADLSSRLRISHQTVKKYLWYLEKTYILHRLTPFVGSVRNEITRSPTYYFVDIGLRNYVLGLFGVLLPTLLQGHVFENYVFQQLYNSISYVSTSIHFWRTQDHAEVDFVVKKGLQSIPVEVKYRTYTKPTISRSYRSFLSAYKPETGYIVHLGGHMTEKTEETTVHFLPFYEQVQI